ncbi:MAG TPA: hypothetical protein PLQ54_18530 [Armatimonadota bacterium]|nr:hypothetical protein [Armatimonadota bacterium]
MTLSITPITGTELSVFTIVTRSSQERRVRRFHHELEDVTTGEWTPLSRSAAREKYPNAWDAPQWKESDLDRVEWVQSKANAQTWKAIEHIARTGNVTGDEVAAAVGYTDAMAWKSALPHLSAYCLRIGRRPLWDVERSTGTFRYYVSPTVGALLAELEGSEEA